MFLTVNADDTLFQMGDAKLQDQWAREQIQILPLIKAEYKIEMFCFISRKGWALYKMTALVVFF